MKFDDFDKKMRKYEESIDQVIDKEYFIVARLDGKGFTKLTKENSNLKKPFDIKFRDCMINTIKYLMQSEFPIIYAYTESDEISLLFKQNTSFYNRKVRKYNSLLAAETSVKFSQEFCQNAIFDCRIIPLPNIDAVQDYFLWRMEDSHRNSIYAHCFYKLLEENISPIEATKELSGKILNEKESILSTYNIDIKSIPNWEIYGTGIYWKIEEKTGFNPVKNKEETTTRNKLFVDYNLPLGTEYKELISEIIK